ncbi:MAG: FHA domain-containing protein [Desulfobacterales bacterium]|nr:FHA domain-containing protein [Desulfobacterales bacterium]
MLKLIVQEPGSDPREVILEKDSYTIGRSQSNDIVVKDAMASREHAVVRIENDGLYIEDCNSTGGVFVDNSQIERKTSLQDGATIEFGLTRIHVVASEAPEKPLELENNDETKVLSPDQYQQLLSLKDEGEPQQVPKAELGGKIDKTVIFHPVSSEAPPPSYHKLYIVSENDNGKEYLLSESENIMGRAPDCHIQVKDQMASGKHAVIRVLNDKCTLKDLKSTNGVSLNGKRIRDEHDLNDGDEIEIGEVKFKFVHKDAVFSKERRPPGAAGIFRTIKADRPKLIAGGLVGVVLLLFLFIIFGGNETEQTRVEKTAGGQREQTGEEKKTPPSEARQKTADASEKARNEKKIKNYLDMARAYENHQLWQSAIDTYEAVLAVDPEYGGVKEAIQNVTLEKKNQSALNQAKELLAQEKYDDALAKLTQIPAGSYYYDKAGAMKAELEEKRAQQKAAAAKKAREKARAEAVKPEGGGEAATEASSKRVDRAVNHYRAGDIEKALGSLDNVADPASSKAGSMRKRILEAQKIYQSGIAAADRKETGKALKAFYALSKVDNKISGDGAGFFLRRLGSTVADQFSDQANTALAAQRYQETRDKIVKALQIKPDHAKANEIRKELIVKAKKLFEKGYILEDLDPEQAVNLWKQVMDICPEDHAYYQKAKSHIAQYE